MDSFFDFGGDFAMPGSWWGNEREEVTTTLEEVEKSVPDPPAMLSVMPERQYCHMVFGLSGGKPVDLPDLAAGDARFFLTGGELGAMMYVDMILRACPRLEHMLIVTWAVCDRDARRLSDLVESGSVAALDIIAGDVMPKQYKRSMRILTELSAKDSVRYAVYPCHAKIISARGNGMWFGVQTTANFSSHRRTEIGSVLCERSIYDFYVRQMEPLFVKRDGS